jgi:hypothetical protein
MTTNDLQRIDELVHSADMAVRVASQLRLWLKRRTVSDNDAINEGSRFISEALQGGKFVATGEMASAASSLSPLTWSADIRFGFDRSMQSNHAKPQSYEDLLQFLEEVRLSLSAVSSSQPVEDTKVEKTAKFFDQLRCCRNVSPFNEISPISPFTFARSIRTGPFRFSARTS